jgi:hypothetical protein
MAIDRYGKAAGYSAVRKLAPKIVLNRDIWMTPIAISDIAHLLRKTFSNWYTTGNTVSLSR